VTSGGCLRAGHSGKSSVPLLMVKVKEVIVVWLVSLVVTRRRVRVFMKVSSTSGGTPVPLVVVV
jgi:hypothetical protein